MLLRTKSPSVSHYYSTPKLLPVCILFSTPVLLIIVLNPKDIIQSSAPTSNIAFNSTPIASVPRTPATPPSSSGLVVTSAPGHRPVAISIFLWLTFFDLSYKIVNNILTIIKLISGFRANHALAHLFETAPLLCLSPFVLAVLAVIILFLIFKTPSYSRLDHRLLVIFSIIVPTTFSLYVRQLSVSLNIHPLLAFLNETNILFVILIIFLIIFSKNLSSYSESMTDGSTITLALLGSIILFPSFFFTYSLINTSLNPDTKHDSIQSMVGSKVYSPASLPLGLRPDTTFYVDEQKNSLFTSPLVKIAYSTPVSLKSSSRPIVILTQAKVIPEFDLENYLNSQLTTNSTKAVPIEITTALNQKALVKMTDPSSSSPLKMTSLAFITPDYILINLLTTSVQVTQDHLKSIAESLR